MSQSDAAPPPSVATAAPSTDVDAHDRRLVRDAARPRAHRSCWLLDHRGRPYRAPGDALFQLYHQAAEGAPWFRVPGLGGPMWLPTSTTRTQFVAVAASLGFRPGRYQLTPVTALGTFIGDPPGTVDYTGVPCDETASSVSPGPPPSLE